MGFGRTRRRLVDGKGGNLAGGQFTTLGSATLGDALGVFAVGVFDGATLGVVAVGAFVGVLRRRGWIR
jgi:hypothetical protein